MERELNHSTGRLQENIPTTVVSHSHIREIIGIKLNRALNFLILTLDIELNTTLMLEIIHILEDRRDHHMSYSECNPKLLKTIECKIHLSMQQTKHYKIKLSNALDNLVNEVITKKMTFQICYT